MAKKGILYLRVSSDEQASNNSLAVQYDDCSAYARQHNIEVVEVLREDFTGTVPLETRPEGRKAYDQLKRGAADVIVVWRMNRLVRPPEEADEWEIPILIRSLAKLGKEIHLCDRGQLRTDFASLLIATLDARESGNDRRAILEKLTRGTRKKAENGRLPCTGRPPYGYKFVKLSPQAKGHDGLEVYEPEAAIVRQIYRLYLHGDGTGGEPLTFRAIAVCLSSEGIPSPSESQRKSKKKRGPGIWDESTISRILRSTVYKGEAKYGRQGTYHRGQERAKREASAVITIPVPAIVDASVWAQVQARSESNKRLASRNQRRRYLVSGMIKCSCGYSMAGRCTVEGGVDYRYYQCNSVTGHYAGLEEIHSNLVNAERVEAAAWAFLLEVISERDTLAQRLKEAQAAELEILRPQRDKLDSVKAMIADVEVEADQVAREMRSIPEERRDGVTYKALEKQSAAIDERYAGLLHARAKIEADLAAAIITDESIADFTVFSDDVAGGINAPTYESQRRWLDYLKIKVEVDGKRATVSCRLPIPSQTFDLSTTYGILPANQAGVKVLLCRKSRS